MRKEKEERRKINKPFIEAFKQWVRDNPYSYIEIEESDERVNDFEMPCLTILKKGEVLYRVNKDGFSLEPIFEKIMKLNGERNDDL